MYQPQKRSRIDKSDGGFLDNLIGLVRGDYPSYLPKEHPGKAEDITRESYEFSVMQSSLFMGVQLVHDLTPTENLKLLTHIKAGTPGKDATFSTSAFLFDRSNFVQAQFDGVSTMLARGRIGLARFLNLSFTTKVGSDYTKNFIAECGMDILGKNYTIELQYEGSQEHIAQASYTQTIVPGLFGSTSFIYSLQQKSSILSLSGRAEMGKMALTGSILLPQVPNVNILIPNRLTTGFALYRESPTFLERYSTEFQMNPAEDNIFDTIVVGSYDIRRRGSRFRVGLDSALRLFVLYEEEDPSPIFGSISLSAFSDYKKDDYKFGLGFTLRQ